MDYFYEGLARYSKSEYILSTFGYNPGLLENGYGYLKIVNDDGDISIENLYDENNQRFTLAGIFQGDYAIVATGSVDQLKFGVINKSGDYVLEPTYDYINKEIVDNKIIVANNVTFIPFLWEGLHSEFTYEWLFKSDSIPYYSDEIGVYDLESGQLVIENTHDIVTCLGDNEYFVWDEAVPEPITESDEETTMITTYFDVMMSYGKIINLANDSETILNDPYYFLMNYDDQYWLGLYKNLIYLVDKESGLAVAEYKKYSGLLDYFNIPTINNFYLNPSERHLLLYNFDTYMNNANREIDFIREDLYFAIEITEFDTEIEYDGEVWGLIDKYGDIVNEFPTDYYFYWGNFGDDFTTHIVYRDSLIPFYHYDSITNDMEYKYINMNGIIIDETFSYVSHFYNGYALCSKTFDVNGQDIEILYNIDAAGHMKQIDLGFNYYSNQHYDSSSITQVTKGIYYIKTSSGKEVLINSYGNIISPEIELNTVEQIYYDFNESSIIPDHLETLLNGVAFKNDLLLINRSSNGQLLYIIRDEYRASQDNPIVKMNTRFYPDIETWVANRDIYPFIFNFNSTDISVYLDNVIVDPSNYNWNEELQHLLFSRTYIENLEDSILRFTIRAGDQATTVNIYKDGIPANVFEFNNDYSAKLVSTFRRDRVYDYLFTIYNIDSINTITDFYLNGIDISNYVTAGDNYQSVESQYYIDRDFLATLEPGIYLLTVGNSVRHITFTVIIK